MSKPTIRIQYCGGCGYGRYFEAIKTLIVKKYPQQFKIIGDQDIGITGNFEVTVDGTLIWSKKEMGDRFRFPHENVGKFWDKLLPYISSS
jgi:selT/selW/selH-like putative selenoprotein